jgi:hypothetical protein
VLSPGSDNANADPESTELHKKLRLFIWKVRSS